MTWIIGENRNIFLKFKPKLRLQHVVLTTTKTSPEKNTSILVKMQSLSKIEQVDSKNESSSLK